MPPQGVPFSTTYIAPSSEASRLSQRVDVPIVCMAVELDDSEDNDDNDMDDKKLDELEATIANDGPSLRPDVFTTSASGKLRRSRRKDGTVGAASTDDGGDPGATQASGASGGVLTAKAARGLKAPFALRTNPTDSPLTVSMPAAELALRLASVNWAFRAEEMHRAATEAGNLDVGLLPPKPVNELTRQDYEPRPWDWERQFNLSQPQSMMLSFAMARIQLMYADEPTVAQPAVGGGPASSPRDVPSSIFLPPLLDCGLYSIDLGAYNSLIQLHNDRRKKRVGGRIARAQRETLEESASTAVGELLRTAAKLHESAFDPIDLLPRLCAVGTLFARVDAGGVYYEFRDVRRVVQEINKDDDSGSDEDEAADDNAQAATAVAAEMPVTLGAGAGAGIGGDGSAPPRVPQLRTVEKCFIHTDAFWRLAAVQGNSVSKSMYTVRTQRIPLFKLPDEVPGTNVKDPRGNALAERLTKDADPVDGTQVFHKCEPGSLVAMVARRLFLERRQLPLRQRRQLHNSGARAAAPWKLHVDGLLYRRLVQLSLAAVEVQVFAINDGLLFKATKYASEEDDADDVQAQAAAVGNADAAAPAKARAAVTWELALSPSRIRHVVSAAVVKSRSDADPRKAAMFSNAKSIAEAGQLDDPVFVLLPAKESAVKVGNDLGELHLEEGTETRISEGIVDVLMQPRFTLNLCAVLVQELVLVDREEHVVRAVRCCVCSDRGRECLPVMCAATQVTDLQSVKDLGALRLRTSLHSRPLYVPVALRNSTKRAHQRNGFTLPALIGSVEIDEWTTLEEARWLIARDLDKVNTHGCAVSTAM
jgi:hypothetical protein